MNFRLQPRWAAASDGPWFLALDCFCVCTRISPQSSLKRGCCRSSVWFLFSRAVPPFRKKGCIWNGILWYRKCASTWQNVCKTSGTYVALHHGNSRDIATEQGRAFDSCAPSGEARSAELVQQLQETRRPATEASKFGTWHSHPC